MLFTVAELSSRGIIKSNLEDYKGAIQDYNVAIRLNTNIAEVYFNRGNAKYKLQDNRGAIQDYNVAIRLDPTFAGAYVNRGNAKYNLKDIYGGCLDWSKGGELGDSETYDYIKIFCK